MSLLDFLITYFSNNLVLGAIVFVFAISGVLLVAFSFLRNKPRLRSGILFALFSTVVFGWGFIAASLLFCNQLLGLYASIGDRAVQVVLGIALLVSLVATLPFSVLVTLTVPRAIIRHLSQDSASAGELSSFTLQRVVETMGLRSIALLRSPSESPFAYSVGGRAKSALVVSEGLEKLLEREEMEAVITHELAHIRNGDTRTKILISAYRRVLFFDPLLRLVERLYAQEKELLADEDAVRFTGKPASLASALLKISAHSSRSTGHLASSITEGDGLTKPSLEERVNRLLTKQTEFEPTPPRGSGEMEAR